jgi:signal transduction histidine kinase
LYRYRINELLKRQAIRNKIAQDLHDNVGSTLSSISVYSQVAQIYQQQQKEDELQTTLQKIKAASGEMISELNDTVWAINPRNDNMDVMLQRMESFAKPLLAAQNIRFKMQYDKSLTAVNLDMGKRKSLYAIFKEAINNAVKYSGCNLLSVEIRHQSNNIMMQIQDDGKGFEPASVSEEPGASGRHSGGNGLRNMQGRAKEIHGDLKIYSAPGRGTTIRLILPLP